MKAEPLRPAFWREHLAPYAQPSIRRSVLDLLTSVAPYLALTAASYALLQVSYLFVLVLAVPSAGCLLRTFIVFHDCAHGSWTASPAFNRLVGELAFLPLMQTFSSFVADHINSVHSCVVACV